MNKSFMDKATFNQKVLFFAIGALMAIFSIYLTTHYFDLKYPTGFEGGSLCNINSFFNCDATTLSALSNIGGVPISIFGIIIGSFVMLLSLYSNDEIEGTLYSILAVNLVGCIVLFLYSLIALGHLCPFCTLYYISSGFAFYMFHKIGEIKKFDIKFLSIYALVFIIVSGISYSIIKGKEDKRAALGNSLIQMFNKLPNLGVPATPSPFRIESSAESFTQAPIQLSVFSDFQCPACKALSPILEKLAEKYKGKINIQYFFYPLDHNCNPKMDRPLHTYACKAAYMATCANPTDFRKIHDDIFANQEKLSDEWINGYATKLGVLDCMSKPETKESVVKMINQADLFSVRSTPTSLLNGVKIEGVRPLSDYYIIIDSILSKQ